MKPALIRMLAALLFSSLLAACASNIPLDAAKKQAAAGDSEAALATLEQALRDNPDDREARSLYLLQRDKMIGKALAEGDSARADGKLDDAELAYRQVVKLDQRNQRASEGLSQIEQARRGNAIFQDVKSLLVMGDLVGAEIRLRQLLVETPAHKQARTLLKLVQERLQGNYHIATEKPPAFSEPISLEFRNAPLRSVFEALTRVSGINFVLDSEVKTDLRITIFVKHTALDEVVKMILVTNQLERKVLNNNSILIYPKIPAKLKDYQELDARSFVLANVDVKQALNLIKTVVKSKDIFVDEKRNLLVIRDTPEAIQLAERLLEALDVAEPEVMLEVEVLEVSRNRLKELGLRFPDQIGYGVQAADGSLSTGIANLNRGSSLIPYTVNPALLLNLRVEDTDTNLLANPRIRVRNMEKAKIHIGDKVPVFTTTSTANVGVSAAVNYLDVGLKLEVEPNVYLKDEVGMRVGLEVSSITKTIEGPQGSIAYQIGTRSATTVLRLRDGETQILAGLISDEERNSANKLPGLGDIPLVGRLFSSRKDSRNKTEIVLLMTPHIVRNLSQPSVSASNVSAGTEGSIGVPPLRLRTTAPGSLGMSGGGSTLHPAGQDALATPEVPASVPLPDLPPPVLPPGSPQGESGQTLSTTPPGTIPGR